MKNAAQRDTEAIERLKELGLTEYDAKVYYTLVAKSPLTAIDISREADVPMSKIYVVLSRLENGGWVSVVPERPKQYRAVDPDVTVDSACSQAAGRLEETRSLLRRSLKETFDSRTETEVSEFLVVHGTVNALNHLREIVQSQRAGITIIAAFANAHTVERIGEMVKDYAAPKRMYLAYERESKGQYAGLLPQMPYAIALEADEKWNEGVVFVYTKGAGMYATVAGDDFKKALIIRDRGLLELMKTLIEGAHHNAIRLGSEDPETHAAKLVAHSTAALEKLDRLIGKHK